jgi:broad specificity phosphatase PhoE
VRKQALILLLRLRKQELKPERVVKYCLHEVAELKKLVGDASCALDRITEIVRSLRYGIEAMKRVGCEVEVKVVRRIRDELFNRMRDIVDPMFAEHFNEVIEHLSGLPWWPEAVEGEELASGEGGQLVYMIRHGESEGNEERRLLGTRVSGGLTAVGLRQAQLTAEYLAGTEVGGGRGVLLVTSPAERASRTAEAIAAALGCDVNPEPGLIELNFGDWSGARADVLAAADDFRTWQEDKWMIAPPGGESLLEVRTRVCRAVARWLVQAVREGRALILVTHFFPLIGLYDVFVEGESVKPDNGSVTCFAFDSGRWSPVLVNHTAHLGERGHTPVAYV